MVINKNINDGYKQKENQGKVKNGGAKSNLKTKYNQIDGPSFAIKLN